MNEDSSEEFGGSKRQIMTSSQATCLLCLSTDKSTINFYSDRGRELNIVSILTTHFWFELDEIKILSQNICCDCWQKTESFHEFYLSIETTHKEFETVFVKKEKELDIEDDGEMYKSDELSPQDFNIELVKMENDAECDESKKMSHPNSIETRGEPFGKKASIPNKRKIGGMNSKQINCKRSTEAITSSTSTSTATIVTGEDAEAIAFDLLPEKSLAKYLRCYDRFMAWKTSEKIDKDYFSAKVVLDYFNYLQRKYKPSTLWIEYSMLRTTIQSKHNIDISYKELWTYLRTSSFGYLPQKLSVFKLDEMQRFLSEADDKEFLAMKNANDDVSLLIQNQLDNVPQANGCRIRKTGENEYFIKCNKCGRHIKVVSQIRGKKRKSNWTIQAFKRHFERHFKR